MIESRFIKSPAEENSGLSLIDQYENIFYSNVDLPLVEGTMQGLFSRMSLGLDMSNEVSFCYDKKGRYLGYQLPGTNQIVFNVAKIGNLAEKYRKDFHLDEQTSIHMAMARVYHHEMWHVVSDTGFRYGGYEVQEVGVQSVDISMRAFNEAVTEFLTQMSFSQYARDKFDVLMGEQDIGYKDYASLVREIFYLISDLNYSRDYPVESPDKYFEGFWKKVVQGYVSKDVQDKHLVLSEFEAVLGKDFFFLLSKLGSVESVPEFDQVEVLKLLHAHVEKLREVNGLKTRKTFTGNLAA